MSTAMQPDDELAYRVRNFLQERQVPGWRELQVSAQDGTVLVRGRLPSFYAKQLCQQAVQRVAGVLQLVDEVTVA